MPTLSRWVVAAGVGIGLLGPPSAAAAQSGPSPNAPVVVSADTLNRIRKALAEEPRLVTTAALTPTFYAQADAKVPTFASYLKGWVPPRGPGGGGLDLLQLVRAGIHKLQQAQRERQADEIRTQIDRDLDTFYGVK